MHLLIGKPTRDEYPEWFWEELDLVEYTDLIGDLTTSLPPVIELLSTLTLEQLEYRYQPDKWTIREMWQHVIDTERVLSYRAMRYSRGDQTVLSGFDHDRYVVESDPKHRLWNDMLEEHTALRTSTIQLFKSFTEEMIERRGTAGRSHMTVRAVGGLIYAHQTHHINIIRERYL